MESLMQFINQVGFPIAISAYLLYQNKQEQDAHEKEMMALVEALNNNTNAITKLEARMESEKNV